jgi:fructose-1,6-bisphosphatase I
MAAGTPLTAHLLRRAYDPELTLLVGQVALAARRIAAALRTAPLHGLLGPAGATNVQGEEQQRLDRYANAAFLDSLRGSGLVAEAVSEELAEPVHLASHGAWTLLFDPLDGSSNLDGGAAVGSIFAVRRRTEVLADGGAQRLAGYALYGPATWLVLAAPGEGVQAFVLDPAVGEFVLVTAGLRLPERGPTLAVNLAHAAGADLERLLAMLPGRSLRYSGALVADCHRILRGGGAYLYPGDAEHPQGKLRLLYEAAPLALVVREAGGEAMAGDEPVLAVRPAALHQRVPLALGSPQDVRAWQALGG